MQATRTATRKPLAIPTGPHSSRLRAFPSYPSNHGSAGNAAAEVLRRLYGEDGHSITLTNPAVPTIILQYTSFKQITDDISDARVYGGIHFRTDQEAGARLGQGCRHASTRTTCVLCTMTTNSSARKAAPICVISAVNCRSKWHKWEIMLFSMAFCSDPKGIHISSRMTSDSE